MFAVGQGRPCPCPWHCAHQEEVCPHCSQLLAIPSPSLGTPGQGQTVRNNLLHMAGGVFVNNYSNQCNCNVTNIAGNHFSIIILL